MIPKIEDWMLKMPELTSGKNKLHIYAFLVQEADINKSDIISISIDRLENVLKISNAYRSLSYLERDGLIEKVNHGKYAGNSRGYSNKYLIKYPESVLGDQMAKLKLEELENLTKPLLEYIDNLPDSVPEYVKASLREFVNEVKPNITVGQFRLALNTLFKYCTHSVTKVVNYNECVNRIEKGTRRHWRGTDFVFDGEMEAKFNKENPNPKPVFLK